MLEKYKQEVMRFYELKKAAGELSPNLMNFTPANIRNEARLLFTRGCQRADQEMLREFFGLIYDNEISDLIFKKCDPDRFKPLCNFLRRGIKSHERNIEMLAWLIDFNPRPFSTFWRSIKGPTALSKISVSDNGALSENELIRNNYSHLELVIEEPRERKKEHLPISNRLMEKARDIGNQDSKENVVHPKLLTIEFPSGAKINVDASDLPLISQLVKL